jgi:hypothetical protein
MILLRPSSIVSLATVALVLVAGCDNQVLVDDGAGGSGGGAGGDNGQGGEGAGDVCDAFADADASADVVIRFRNDDSVPIYLPGNCSTVAFSLVAGSGTETSYPVEGTCLQTCEDLQIEDPFACDACAPAMYRLDPGGQIDVRWDGTGLRQASMPSECFFSDFGSGGGCSQIVAAPSGDYAVDVLGYADCGQDCTCDDASGQCFGFPSGGGVSPAAAVVSLPTAATVEVVFQPCSFGCPL